MEESMLERRIRISSSVENFKEKLLRRTNLPEWKWHIFSPTVFVGMYHIGDYIRLLAHIGKRKVFWCGSDILSLPKWLAPFLRGTHYCESIVERKELARKGIHAKVLPMIFAKPISFDAFQPLKSENETLHIYMNMHKHREAEYGMTTVSSIRKFLPNTLFHIYGIEGRDTEQIKFHGRVDEKTFNRDIKNYHVALRTNEFDGFSEILAKSVLLGQYPISRIPYPGIETYSTEEELIQKILAVREKKFVNGQRVPWRDRLENNLQTLITF